MDHTDRLRQNLQNSLTTTGVTVGQFSTAAGFYGPTTVTRFLMGGRKWYAWKVIHRIESEMRRRGWLAGEEGREAPPTATTNVDEEKPSNDAPAETHFDLPYPEVTEIKGANGRDVNKYLANVGVIALAENPNHPNKAKVEQIIADNRRIADMTEDEYTSHRMYESNPINKLTREEKLLCIRTLPLEIVNKLFPHI